MCWSSSLVRGRSPIFPIRNCENASNGTWQLASWEPLEGVTSHSSLATSHCISNRYTARLECPVTHSKQTSLVLSNRYEFAPPGGVPSGLLPRPAHYRSNRNTVETGFAVTRTKQTTAVLSNRNKKTPPGGVPSELHKTKIRRTVEERQGNSRSLTPIRRRRGWVREDNGRRGRAQAGWRVLISLR